MKNLFKCEQLAYIKALLNGSQKAKEILLDHLDTGRFCEEAEVELARSLISKPADIKEVLLASIQEYYLCHEAQIELVKALASALPEVKEVLLAYVKKYILCHEVQCELIITLIINPADAKEVLLVLLHECSLYEQFPYLRGRKILRESVAELERLAKQGIPEAKEILNTIRQ